MSFKDRKESQLKMPEGYVPPKVMEIKLGCDLAMGLLVNAGTSSTEGDAAADSPCECQGDARLSKFRQISRRYGGSIGPGEYKSLQ